MSSTVNDTTNSTANNIALLELFPNANVGQIEETFSAALRSVGAVCVYCAVGIYLHRRGFIVGEGKKTLALICQQALIPVYLCAKTMYCDQNHQSNKACPDIVTSLSGIWFLLLWPAYVVGMGCIVSTIMKICIQPPKQQIKPMYAAIMFGNSTALPITMLTVVHSNFPNQSKLGKVDPTLFLSIYLLLYPILQWGIGGWLLAPDAEIDEKESNGELLLDVNNNKKKKLSSSEYGTILNDQTYSTIAEESSSMATSSSDNIRTPSSSTPTTPRNDLEKIELLRKQEQENNNKATTTGGRGSSSSSSLRTYRHVLNILPEPPRMIRNFSNRLSDVSSNGDGTKRSSSLGTIKVNTTTHQQRGSGNNANIIGIHHRNDSHASGVSGGAGGYGHYDEMMDHSSRASSSGFADGFNHHAHAHRHSSVHVPAFERQIQVEINNPDAIAINHQTGMTPVDPFVNFVPRHNMPSELVQYEGQSGDPIVAQTEETLLLLAEQQQNQQEDNSASPSATAYETTNFWSMVSKIMGRVFQPPCVGALLGLFITAFPSIRGVFIDMEERADNAPLEWAYDALLKVGESSIPIIMIVLGCNLSASQLVEDESRLLSSRVVVAIICSKMIIMPIIGFVTTLFCKNYVWNVPPDIAPSFYLVVMIVFITPTANNVMVMVELSGVNVKEGVARCIAYQYMLAPFLLSVTTAFAVGIANTA